MEETLSTSKEPEFDEKLCANCQSFPYEGNHPINLCSSCRTNLVNYPIPKWIRVFALILLGVIVISLVRTQRYISAAVYLGKGEKAIENKHYVTAQNELIKVLSKFPDDLTANADFFTAAAYNMDNQSAIQAYDKIAEKKVDDEALLIQVNSAYAYLLENFPQDTTTAKKIDSAAKDKSSLAKLAEQLKKATAEPALMTRIANYLYDLEDYKSAQLLMQEVLVAHPNFYSALSLAAATERQLGNFDKAISYCDRILATNKENIYAIAHKSRIELKRKNDQQAAVYASQAMVLNPDDDTALEATAMVNYYAGKKQDALKQLSIINAHAALNRDSTIAKRLTAIINGTKNFR